MHRLDEENNRSSFELHEQFAESRAFFSAQVNQMLGAISAEVSEEVAQRTAQYGALAQSLRAEAIAAGNSEKAISKQRDRILAENHSMQDNINVNGLNYSVERLKSELEKAQEEMSANTASREVPPNARGDPQPASSFPNVSPKSFLDRRGNIFDDSRLFPNRNAQSSGPMPQIIPQQSWSDPISGAMQFDINQDARRFAERERGRGSARLSLASSGISRSGPNRRKLIL